MSNNEIITGGSGSVLVVGRATLDILTKSNGFPGFGEQEAMSEPSVLPGGSALNAAVTFAGLGIHTALCCKLGDDSSAFLVKQFLEERNISLSFVKTDVYLPTSLSLINIGKNGEIAILHNAGANQNLNAGDLPLSQLATFDLVHIGGAMLLDRLDGEPTAEFLKKARDAGALISLHTTRNTRRRSVLFPVFGFLDYFFLNRKESLEISGCRDIESACKWFHKKGVKTAAITCGAEGVYVSGPGFCGLVPGIAVTAVDTTGCGDAFTAGFLSAALSGMDLQTCAQWGNAAGAHCARTIGAVPVPFRADEIRAMIDTFETHGECAALVLAGGLSRRMSNAGQKLVMPLTGKPLVVWGVECLRRLGMHRLIAIVGHQGDKVKKCLSKQPIEFVNAAGPNSGTGDAIKKAVSDLKELPGIIYIINGDTPLLQPETLIRLREELVRLGSGVTAAIATTPDFRAYGHGAVITNEQGDFERIEHYSMAAENRRSGFVNTGTYCFSRDALVQGCEALAPAADGKIHFSDILSVLKKKQVPVKLMPFEPFDQFISANTIEQFKELEELIKTGA
ncbi:MAG: NTP transferase domain-containing protein [bacterium]|nr:NTP transferase domain-containing protein [bacterium]